MARPLIVSLTSIPPRFAALGGHLSAILAQRPNGLVVTLPESYERFPDWDGALPELPADVHVLRGEDHGPATKWWTASRAYPDADLLICDDDCVYGPGWVDAFRAARDRNPQAVIAAHPFDAARIGGPTGAQVVQGYAGVLFAAEWIQGWDAPIGTSRWVDDVLLSAKFFSAGRAIVGCADALSRVFAQDASQPLQDVVLQGQNRAALNRAAVAELFDRDSPSRG